MSEIANNEGASETEKPAQNDVKFPPFPAPTDDDFDEDISEEERQYYKNKFKDLNDVKTYRLHCTSCDRHLGCSARNDRIKSHPMLRTLVCHSCHTFYNSGEFEKGDDGSELYCRWCGQGGQVYCCSGCPHVFCAKCIKRNLGVPKIKEIENADDWKCFKCNPECLMDLRSVCWAVLRYCDLKNKLTYLTEDPDLKAAYQKDCALDVSECCKHKTSKRNQRLSEPTAKKKEVKKDTEAKTAANIISKIPPTIQVKKFASINNDDTNKTEKKAQKRPASPKAKKLMVKNPIAISPGVTAKILTPIATLPPLAKKIRLPNPVNSQTVKFQNVRETGKNIATYARIRPKPPPQLPIPIVNSCYNGFSGNVFQCSTSINDTINLSLESLTQGLDMAAMAALSKNNAQDDDVVCTPDFPLEPLCEVTEDNDDDVECITPGPVAPPKVSNPPPLLCRSTPNISDISNENIIQMTDNDVTVNESTGGLKFRVDPQTLSSNKMYRLPDGRIFAINANPNMPGGYSATIVAVTESNKGVPKGATFAAKLNAVTTSTPTAKNNRNQVTRFVSTKRNTSKVVKAKKTTETSTRECDLNVPVEWYRYNLIDAVDALEYSLSRLQKLKTEATSVYLRTRSVTEMRNLHRTLERLLSTSSSRFNEIRENLNKGLKQYVQKKSGVGSGVTSEEDDDVEILPDIDDDPIFIDENSVESNMNGSDHQEVDLTGPGSSEYNDSEENKNDNRSRGDADTLNATSDNECGLMFSISHGTEKAPNPVQRDRRTSDDSRCKVNGIGSTQKVVNKSNDDTNISRTTTYDKADKQSVCGDSDGQVDNVEDKLEKSDKKSQGVDAEVQDIDTNAQDSSNSGEKLQSSDDKLQESDDKLQESDDKLQESDDKLQKSEDKLQTSDKTCDAVDNTKGNIVREENSDDNSKSPTRQEGTNDSEDIDSKFKDSDDKLNITDFNMDAEDRMQYDNVIKTDDSDKIQDSEMSEEMIANLLNDDNTQDSATTNSEVPKPLSVT